MRKEFFYLLSYFAVFTFVCVGMYFGVYFDQQSISAFLLTALLAPILAYAAIEYQKNFTLEYISVAHNFTRSVTLQIIDPLLN